ncbi:MAG: hypothetical protein RMJ43_07175 [Chloroherpetonaceae bacterium]|nr:hypothetical protein [Chloroherpetonaceae bacterium]
MKSTDNALLVTVIYDASIDERLLQLLQQLHIPGWTRIASAHGAGGRGRKEDNPIWPGTVNLLLIALPENEAETLIHHIRNLQNTYRRKPGITIWTQPITLR